MAPSNALANKRKGIGVRPLPGSFCVLSIILFGLVCAPRLVAQEPEGPDIVAQGFDMAIPREGRLGKFGRLRIRIEAPERISRLYIRERSYEVDLATTLDKANYDLFGLEKRVRHYKDVTLDFHNYINEKIKSPGTYEFLIEVNDARGGAARASLAIAVTAEAADKTKETDVNVAPMKTGSFRFERAGPGRVKGGADFGITWKTVDAITVVIRISVVGSGHLAADGLLAAQYEKISDRTDVDLQDETGKRSGFVGSIEIPTARNAAAGRVLAIDRPDRFCMMKVDRSKTSLSDIGTTVELQGEYKCAEK